MTEMPMRYNIATDEMVPVTQEWVHGVEKVFQKFGNAREAAKEIITKGYLPVDSPVWLQVKAFLDAWRPEFEQKP